MMGAIVGVLETVGAPVVSMGVGSAEMVGAVVVGWVWLAVTDISTQLKNCSGQVVPLVPSSG